MFLLSVSVLLLPACSSGSKKEEKQKEKTGLFPIYANGLQGLMDRNGKVVLEPNFENIGEFHEGVAHYFQNGKYGLLNKDGQAITGPIYDLRPGKHSSGLISVKLGNKYGYINAKGETKINPQYDYANDFNDGFAQVRVNNNEGIIDRNGQWVIQPNYQKLGEIKDGLIAAQLGNNFGFLDKEGKLVINPQYQNVSNFRQGLALVQTGGKFGLIDKSGKIVVNPQFDYVSNDFEDVNWILVGVGGMVGAINKQGEYIVSPQYKFIRKLDEGYYIASSNAGTSVLDTNGDIILNPTPGREIKSYLGNQKFIVDLGGKQGIVNSADKYLVQPTLDKIYNSQSGLYRAKQNGKFGYLKENGSWAVQPQFEDAQDFQESRAWVKVGFKWGLIDKGGQWIVNPQFNSPKPFFDGLAHVIKGDGTNGYLDTQGQEVGQFYQRYKIAPSSIQALMDQYFPNWEYGLIEGNETFFIGNDRFEPYCISYDFNGDGNQDYAVRVKNGENPRNSMIAAFLSVGKEDYDIFYFPGYELLEVIKSGYFRNKFFPNGGIGTGIFEAGDGSEVFKYIRGSLRTTIFSRASYEPLYRHRANEQSSTNLPPINTEILSSGESLISWVDKLNVRAIPQTSGEVIYQLKGGEKARYLGEKTTEKINIRLRGQEFYEPWLKIQLDNGKEGWVFAGAVRIAP
ncbi:MAG: WG repeat-containing protein [Bacteroidota bacterium]